MEIRKKLMMVILLTCGAVLLLTSLTFAISEFITFRQTAKRQLATLGEVIAANSTAALAFDSKEDAAEILSALKAEKHIVEACLYDENGNVFSLYQTGSASPVFPAIGAEGYLFEDAHLVGFQKVFQDEKYLGMLYLKSDMNAMYDQLVVHGVIASLAIIVSLLMAYLLSKKMQQSISKPILALAEVAKIVSQQKDYSVRATKVGQDEIGLLTDAFNQMLTQIQEQNIEITSFNQKLEQSVQERTNDLNRVNKELEAFSYSVSHDLRAPLRSVNGYAQMLQEDHADKLDKDGLRITNVIIESAKRMGKLIDDLLDFSRMGRQEIVKSTINMDTFVKGVVDELMEGEQERHINIVVHRLGVVSVDPNMIRQVWVNLISNALKYSRKKENVYIEIGSTVQPGEIIYFVKDNGAGFNMDYAHKLFGVFQRLHKESEFEGTGVGLALSKRIIDRHRGRIWVDSKLNEGTTFFFSIPNQ